MQWWSKEIHVAISSGTSVVVNSSERAAVLLLNEWPTEDSPKQIGLVGHSPSNRMILISCWQLN